MGIVTFALLISQGKLKLSQCYTLMYIFTFVQGSIGFLPALMTFAQDAIISFSRISAFLKLPEIDRSYLNVNYEYKDAIHITGGHSYSYGLEDDHQVKPELDPLHYMKMDRLKTFRRLNLVKKLRKMAP